MMKQQHNQHLHILFNCPYLLLLYAISMKAITSNTPKPPTTTHTHTHIPTNIPKCIEYNSENVHRISVQPNATHVKFNTFYII